MKQTAVEWIHELSKQRELDKFDWEQAKEMEKEKLYNIRQMLIEGALTDMSCASAIVEFDKEIEKFRDAKTKYEKATLEIVKMQQLNKQD